ncbi:DUF362 domain-containing protein [Candidatus Shapirobacteria bacterium]|nr:DUF362 domain-containing protein [Candidatus Shapirobacteria bacterium]
MSSVRVIKTKPATVVDDYSQLVKRLWLPEQRRPVIIKVNLSWTKVYPACSSPPWQLEGAIKGLLDLGYSKKEIIPVENKTVVTDVYQGAKNHGWEGVCKKHGVKLHYLTEEKYGLYQPKAKMLALSKIFPQGILLPNIIRGKDLISLCTLKTHVFTQTTGAIKNYFGMLNTKRHHAHRFIHQAIIDLLAIQHELHPQRLALMDGSVVGYGAGPRAMEWKEANLILGSGDQVALDSVAAKIIGLDPLNIKYLKLGKKLGLGENDVRKIKIEGVKKLPNFHLKQKDNFASKGQNLIYHKFPWGLEKLLLQTLLVPWSYLASRAFYDLYWYNAVGKKRVKDYFNSDWGKLFLRYQK